MPFCFMDFVSHHLELNTLFTSIIVNFYNEMNHRRDYKKIEQIEKEVERIEDEEKEKLNKRDL